MAFKFRAHHFLCALSFEGKGYSPRFIKNFYRITETLNEESEVEVVDKLDNICSACPNHSNNQCLFDEKIRGLDTKHAEILKINVGDVLTWGEAKSRIKAEMTLSRFHQACASCSWKALGVCEKKLKSLNGYS